MSKPTIEKGADNHHVRDLQEALVEKGYDISVDGIFGRGTEAAVIAFQESEGLDADGIVGRNTWAALGY